MIKAVIFDMDGTLLDSERIGLKAWQYVIDKYSLCLLYTSCTRHHRNTYNVLGVNSHLLCPVCLCDGAVHLLRRFAGRKVGDKFGEVSLAESYPAG